MLFLCKYLEIAINRSLFHVYGSIGLSWTLEIAVPVSCVYFGYIWTCFGVSEMGHIYVWMFVFVFTFRLFRINIIMVILKSYIQLYFIWVYLFVFVELGSFCHTCRFIVNLTLNRAMDLSGGAPLLLDTFMLRWSTLIGYLHAGPIYYSYIRSIYLYWKHAIPVACRAVPFLYTLYILAVYLYFYLSCCSTVL